MPAPIRIDADLSPLKRSLTKAGKEVNSWLGGGGKKSILNKEERQFFEKNLKESLEASKKELESSKNTLVKLRKEEESVIRGTKEEYRLRKQINQELRNQKRLSENISKMEGASGGGGGAFGFLKSNPAITAALGLGLYAGSKVMKTGQAYAETAPARTRLMGLGISGGMPSPEQLAASGLTASEFLQQQTTVGATLGRGSASPESVVGRARFERGFGLEKGSLGNLMNSLRPQFGAAGTDRAMLKLQASILANNIEEGLAPYLEASTQLLSQINENGVTQTKDLIRFMGVLTKQGGRTPEQISRAFTSLNDALIGSSGEQNAFFQSAFARAGIGGGTVGGTKLAVETGMFGLDAETLRNRGFNLQPFEEMNLLGGGKRNQAILSELRKAGGLSEGQSFKDIQDKETLVMVANLANSLFGTKGVMGLDAAAMLQDVESGGMSKKKFESALSEMKKDPMQLQLETINSSIAGQTETLRLASQNIAVAVGENTVKVSNAILEFDNKATTAIGDGFEATTKLLNDILNSQFGKAVGDFVEGVKEFAKKEAPPQQRVSYYGGQPTTKKVLTDPTGITTQ